MEPERDAPIVNTNTEEKDEVQLAEDAKEGVKEPERRPARPHIPRPTRRDSSSGWALLGSPFRVPEAEVPLKRGRGRPKKRGGESDVGAPAKRAKNMPAPAETSTPVKNKRRKPAASNSRPATRNSTKRTTRSGTSF